MKTTILSLIVALSLLIGCKPTERLIYVDRPVIVERVTVQKDTVTNVIRDSVVFWQNGDTVRIEKWKTIFKDRLSVRVDSVPVVKTVYVDKIVEVEKIKYKTDWIWWTGLISLFAAVGFVVWKIKRIIAP